MTTLAMNATAIQMPASRGAFSTSRALDFFTLTDLRHQSAVDSEEWGLMLAKEAIDNALDACEGNKTIPVISVDVTPERIIVTDNGPGTPHVIVEKIKDFDVTVSSNRHRVQPSRGQQGNAFKTYLAVP